MDATPSVRLPEGALTGIPARPPAPMQVGGRPFDWGTRTFVMAVINVTPDSFSGDGLLAAGASAAVGDPLERAVARARAAVAEGADLLDIGGESTRPGHAPVAEADEIERVAPVVRAIRAALPDVPLSVDTTKRQVAEAAVDAGADLINDVWGVGPSDDLARLAAERGVPLVVMHNRAEPRYRSVVAEVSADLARAVERAVAAGVEWERLIVDPGIGFGKSAEQNLELLRELAVLTRLGRPLLIGTSRKSTIGKVLDLPAEQRLEGTLATTALAVAAGADMLRVHDVAANVRAARMADAIVRGGWREPATGGER
ncbi:MAG TPA: dihydropteroate synthase [Candidatus Limnocylindria bacterium]|nr:dihydropteroate synthase [Candidatus Limnocylindria bacterium]